jgi:predicted permease
MNDFKHAFRQIRKRPGGTIVILGTLSLVIGAMGMILGILQSERTRWMPFPNYDEVVRLWHVSKNGAQERLPHETFVGLEDQVSGFRVLGAMGKYDTQVLTEIGEPKTVSTQQISAEVFDVMGVPLIQGRPFSKEEVRAGEDRIAVISDEAWVSIFEKDPDVIGREVTLNHSVYQIIGVMAPGMNSNGLFYGTDFWLPRDFSSPSAGQGSVYVVGRRESAVSPKQLNAELASFFSPLNLDSASGLRGGEDEFSVIALRADKRPSRRVDGEVVLGLTIPFLVLGIAAFNVANILLARMLMRRHEFAVRFSMGANRWRLIRQLITESTVLALIAASIGMLVAYWTAHWARSRGLETEFSPFVVIGTTLFALIAGVVVGWLPALRATRGDFSSDLKDSSAAAAGGGVSRHRLRNLLVVGQVGMATVLCIAAGLMLRSQAKKRQFDPGFDASKLLGITVNVNRDQYPEPARRSLYSDSVMERLRAVPGVEAVAMASDRSVNRNPHHMGFKFVGAERWISGHSLGLTVTSPNYMEMLNVPLLLGRGLQSDDRRGSPEVILVNQSFVDRYFPDEDPIGKAIGFSIEGSTMWPTIVGVVGDRPNLGRQRDLGPEGYLCINQVAPEWISSSFIIETSLAPGVLGRTIREAVKSVDVALPVGRAIGIESAIERSMEGAKAGLRAMSGIGMFGLLIATIGIYGVVGYSVTERRRELGIRMALGSSRGGVLRLILRQGLSFAVVGLVIGLLLAFAVTMGMEELVYGISPFDFPTYLVVGVVLAASAGLATLIPGLRAMRIDPAQSLRYE